MSNQKRMTFEQEVLTRSRRVETRLINFLRFFGVDPTMDFDEETSRRVTTDGQALYCATPKATVGDLMFVAYKNRLKGPVPVYVAGRFVGSVRALEELTPGEHHDQ